MKDARLSSRAQVRAGRGASGGTRLRDLRMLPVCLAAWPVALFVVYVPAAAVWVVLFGVLGAGLASIAFARHWARIPSGMLLVVATVVLGIGAGVLLAQGPRSEAASLAGTVVQAEIVVESSASVGADGRLWFDAQTRRMGPGDDVAARDVPVRVGVPRGAHDALVSPGVVLHLRAQTAAADAGERAVLVLFAAQEPEVLSRGALPAVIAADVRAAFIDRSLVLPDPGAELLPGLAVGDTRAVTPELDAAMKASGLSHLTAVSGSNCALVTAAGFGLVALLGGGRWLRVLVATAALAAFVVLVTAEPSVIRAATMAWIAMLCLLLGRPRAGLPMLMAAVSVLLVTDPWLSASAGFALSAAATAGLILLARPLARGMERWMPAPIALALAVPLSAQLTCGPIIALFSPQQSIVGVAANLLADPAAPIATGIGLLACLAMPIPPLADLLAACAWLPSAWIAQTALVSASLPGAVLLVPAGIVTAAMVALLSAALAWIIAVRRPDLHPRISGTAALVVALSLGISTGLALIRGPVAPLSRPGDWTIAACDVGQGDALLVRSEGEVMLIDTGDDEAALERCLTSLGIGRIALLVLTHFDADHTGAAVALAGRVDAVLHGPIDDAGAQHQLDALQRAGADVVDAVAGMRGALGEAQWRLLWPRRDDRVFVPGNDLSVSIEIAGPGMPRAIFLGDLSAAAQAVLLRTAHPGRYDLVKVSHHGSVDQDPALYAALRARLALVSVGQDNTYGHPREETLAMLAASGTAVARTDRSGQLLVGMDGEVLTLWTERADVEGGDDETSEGQEPP